MDESGEQFVAYFLPTEETMDQRKLDQLNGVDYGEDTQYTYRMAREYNWTVKSKANKGYEENYFLVVRDDGVYYNELETRWVYIIEERILYGMVIFVKLTSNSKMK
jgi:RNA polymerase II-associated factor 1